MALKVLSDEKPLDVFIEASDILTNAVKHTLGPKGLNTAVCTSSSGVYQIINDGKAIVQDITSEDPVLAPALELLKQSCFETNRVAGDGTTSTILMTNKLLHNMCDYMKKNKKVSAITLRNELLEIRDELIMKVDDLKSEISEKKYEDVATVALGSSTYAKMVADAYKFVGPDGTVAFIREDRRDVELDCTEGVTLDKTEFKIIPMKEPKELYDCPVIVLYEKVDRFADLIELLNKTIEFKGKKTILLYNELSWDAASNIYANIGDNNIDIIPIRMGAYGVVTKDVMEQIAEYTGCKMIDGIKTKLSSIEDYSEVFGKSNKSLVSEDKVVLCTDNKIKKNKNHVLQLSNKSCIIRIGGSNKIEQEETFRRIEDAVSSLSTAIKDGITTGGGLTYINTFESIHDFYKYDYLDDVGEVIYRTVIYNSTGITKIPREYIGLFPVNNEWVEIKSNVFDSSMVVKEVIRNSFSLVAQIITTDKLIHELIR